MGEIGGLAARQAILHGVVAAAFVEAVLRAWRIRRPGSRIHFWLLALAFPFLAPPAFFLVAPFRASDRFAATWALFSADRWNAVRVSGLGVDTLVVAVLALAGTLLFLRDLVPFMIELAREYRLGGRRPTEGGAAFPAHLGTMVANAALEAHVREPEIVVLQDATPILFVSGILQHKVVLSTGTLARLSDTEFHAALAHEMAHVRFRDPLAGWLLMGARLVMFWNPAVQLVGRAVVQEMEQRADAVAIAPGRQVGFAGALRSLALGDENDTVDGTGMRGVMERTAERLRRAHIAERVASLNDRHGAVPFARVRLAVVAAALTAILFFVV